MGLYLSMGTYVVKILTRRKPSLQGIFGLTKKYSFTEPPPKLGEGKGDICTSVVRRETFN